MITTKSGVKVGIRDKNRHRGGTCVSRSWDHVIETIEVNHRSFGIFAQEEIDVIEIDPEYGLRIFLK